jgi:hypothetical protein
MKAITHRYRLFAAALIVLGLVGAIAWMSWCHLFPSGVLQADVELVLEGYEFIPGAQHGYAKVTLRNHTDRKILFPALRYNERRVAAVISTTRKGAEWTASTWDETAKDEVFVNLEAEAGGGVRLLIPLKAGAATKRVALLCSGMPESAMMRLKRAFESELGRIGVPNNLQILPDGYGREVWCSQELCLPDGKVR